jgi:hypothetical protein
MGKRSWSLEHQEIVQEMRLSGFTKIEIIRTLHKHCGLSKESSRRCFHSVVPKKQPAIKKRVRRITQQWLDSNVDWDDKDDIVLAQIRDMPVSTRLLCDALYNQRGPLFVLLLASPDSGIAYSLCRKARRQRRSSFTDLKTIDLSSVASARRKAVQILERYAKARTQESRGSAWARNR